MREINIHLRPLDVEDKSYSFMELGAISGVIAMMVVLMLTRLIGGI